MTLDVAVRADAWNVAALSTDHGVDSEFGRLTRVLLSAPDHLSMVPCNSVTKEALRNGMQVSLAMAAAQHRDLIRTLESAGVETLVVPGKAGLSDQSFARDTTLMTPWGLVGLRPGAFHRRAEVAHVMAQAQAAGVPILETIAHGTIEGGDVCILRPGFVVIGVSGGRTNEEGAEALASIFRRHGWRAMLYFFDPHFLHLDTIFAVVDDDLALGCRDVLDDAFIAEMERSGMEILPVSYKQARRLGCNVVSLGDRRVLSSSDNAGINAVLKARGYEVLSVDVSQFTRCGGGVHCLTMPLARAAV